MKSVLTYMGHSETVNQRGISALGGTEFHDLLLQQLDFSLQSGNGGRPSALIIYMRVDFITPKLVGTPVVLPCLRPRLVMLQNKRNTTNSGE